MFSRFMRGFLRGLMGRFVGSWFVISLSWFLPLLLALRFAMARSFATAASSPRLLTRPAIAAWTRGLIAMLTFTAGFAFARVAGAMIHNGSRFRGLAAEGVAIFAAIKLHPLFFGHFLFRFGGGTARLRPGAGVGPRGRSAVAAIATSAAGKSAAGASVTSAAASPATAVAPVARIGAASTGPVA